MTRVRIAPLSWLNKYDPIITLHNSYFLTTKSNASVVIDGLKIVEKSVFAPATYTVVSITEFSLAKEKKLKQDVRFNVTLTSFNYRLSFLVALVRDLNANPCLVDAINICMKSAYWIEKEEISGGVDWLIFVKDFVEYCLEQNLNIPHIMGWQRLYCGDIISKLGSRGRDRNWLKFLQNTLN